MIDTICSRQYRSCFVYDLIERCQREEYMVREDEHANELDAGYHTIMEDAWRTCRTEKGRKSWSMIARSFVAMAFEIHLFIFSIKSLPAWKEGLMWLYLFIQLHRYNIIKKRLEIPWYDPRKWNLEDHPQQRLRSPCALFHLYMLMFPSRHQIIRLDIRVLDIPCGNRVRFDLYLRETGGRMTSDFHDRK